MKINHLFTETKRTRRTLALLCGLAMMIFAVVLFSLQAANPAHAVTRTPFTVDSNGDEPDKAPGNGACQITTADQCTLRAAIEEANASSGVDTINFAIPGAGPHTISPGSELPAITQPVTIDGYTESLDEGANPANPNTASTGTNAVLKIVLDGTNAGSNSVGLRLISGVNGASASNSVIRGVVINNFSSGILISSGTGYKVEGNFIGTDPSGTVDEGNRSAGVFISTSNTTVGGTTPDKRNLISGNFYGVEASGRDNKIEGNLIGTNKDGTNTPNNLGNSYGVLVLSQSNNNTVGDSDPSDDLTNAANTIAFNFGRGVTIGFGAGHGNRILSNSIFSNGLLGIDLSNAFDPSSGVTGNDYTDQDTGPNGLQNYPVITSAQNIGNFTSINGTLNSTPSTKKKKRTFIIQFFSSPQTPPASGKNDPSGYGEGQIFLGQIQVTTDRQGDVKSDTGTFGFAPFTKVDEGRIITATATNKKTGDTSEFSADKVVTGLGL
jgi:CSLREA domain-containing protein